MKLRERKKAETRQLLADTAWRLFADQGFDQVTAEPALAALLAADTGAPPSDPDAQVAANALVGIQHALVDHTRQRVLADQDLAQLATDIRQAAGGAFALPERGLGDYATSPPAPPPSANAPRSATGAGAEGAR